MAKTESKKHLYIGVMSGTSLNSIDCGLFDFSNSITKVIAIHEHPLSATLRSELLALCSPGENEIHRLGVADRKLGELFGTAVSTLLSSSGVSAEEVGAIGSHGQTIRHHPYGKDNEPAYTLQIGDPNTIVSTTGITTVADFRRQDISLGGQGAPLAPAFHAHAFSSPDENRCIVNIGGIANLTWLPAQGEVQGFDTGPGNVLMNTWINAAKGMDFDNDGSWAAGGKVNEDLLGHLLQEPWLTLAPPKSTGRELFNARWLKKKLQGFDHLGAQDVMTTLTEYTALTIARSVDFYPFQSRVYLCGGGAHNSFLRERICFHLKKEHIDTTDALGIDEDWVEAATFAWLAKLAIEGRSVDFSSITGSTRPFRCGAIYYS